MVTDHAANETSVDVNGCRLTWRFSISSKTAHKALRTLVLYSSKAGAFLGRNLASPNSRSVRCHCNSSWHIPHRMEVYSS